MFGHNPIRPDAEHRRMDRDLDRALEQLELAADHAGSTVQTQLHSLNEGVFEEEAGASTQDEPGPKADRLAEISEKLQGLEEETEDDVARHHIEVAREHVQRYMKENKPSN